MKCVDAKLFQSVADIYSSQHSSVGGALLTVSADFHSSSDAHKGFSSAEVSDMDESVIEACKDVADPEDKFASNVLD